MCPTWDVRYWSAYNMVSCAGSGKIEPPAISRALLESLLQAPSFRCWVLDGKALSGQVYLYIYIYIYCMYIYIYCIYIYILYIYIYTVYIYIYRQIYIYILYTLHIPIIYSYLPHDNAHLPTFFFPKKHRCPGPFCCAPMSIDVLRS